MVPQPREFRSLQFFLNRSAVLAQFRQFLRATAALPNATRDDVRRQIRAGFELYRDEEDERRVGLLLRQGRDQLKMVHDLVDTAVAQQRSQEEAQAPKDWKKGGWTEPKKAETWVEQTPANGDGSEEDVRGRMGVGWPWKSNKAARRLDLEGIKRR